MRIISLNIRHGGGGRLNKILKSLGQYDSDIIILCEYRCNTNGQNLRVELNQMGFNNFAVGYTEHPKVNTVSIFSKSQFEASPRTKVLGMNSHRIIEAVFDNFTLLAVYMPNKYRKKPVFDYILEYCTQKSDENVAIIGDFNTGKHYLDEPGADFICEEYIHKIEASGWIDGWRKLHGDKREYTWYSNKGNGFRIDHIFCTNIFSRTLKRVDYLHHTREENITDHSTLIIDTQIDQLS